jgi:nitroreductase
MRPPNDVAHPVHELIRRRWSPRSFADRPVEPDKLRRVFEAARWAPSSFNAQPWSYLVATKDDPADHARMLGCLVEGNQVWARSAPVLMMSVATNAFEYNGKPNRHAFHDVGAATAFLTLEATALDLFVHQMAGFIPEKVREAYGLPETVEPVAAIALGYPGDPDALPENLRAKELQPGKRKATGEFVFSGAWARRAEWVDG